ncbi:MAG: outer-membrane lipoprotein carrier protein LolA, partial [Spirochaetaceae bacterium]|nr:outer-membrane lipoprotein carrier protein LolA [Spirochaetaceae bacterium]
MRVKKTPSMAFFFSEFLLRKNSRPGLSGGIRAAVSSLFLGLVMLSPLGAQNQILTASAFFKQVSDYYGGIRDMEATVQITVQKSVMSAKLSYKRPDLLRMDFTSPKDQVLVFNGETLTIYLPGSSAILNQSASRTSEGAHLATPQGLSLMN